MRAITKQRENIEGETPLTMAAPPVVMSLGGGKKRPAPAAAAFGEEEGGKKESEAVAVRDLEDGLNQGPKIIEMKQTGGWHRGRLQKTSNADLIMEQVKKGGNVVMDDEPVRAPEASNFCGGDVGDISAADAARAALVKDALAERDRPEGEEKTLGLTIETGKAVSRALDSKDKKIDLEKIDLENCGEETKLTDYDAMPIAEFGMALMRGMGWKDGEALGGSRKGIIEPIDIKAQPEGLGLGAVPKAESPGRDKRGGKRFVPKPGQEKDHREEAKDRIRKEAAARLGSFEVGMKVAIISGRHRGLTGTISYSYAHEIMVTLTASGEEVTVDKKDLDSDVSKAHHIKTREEEERERQEEERQRRRAEDRDKARERSDRDRDRERDRERDRDRDRDRDVRDRGKAGGGGGREEAGAWLRPHIRVRIIDKDLKAGKYYLKKCRVLDVVGRGICTLQVEDTRALLEEISHKMLETVVPKTGGSVIILAGRPDLRGKRCVLLQKDKEKEQASVQLTGEDMRIETVSLDHIAEFVGGQDDLLE